MGNSLLPNSVPTPAPCNCPACLADRRSPEAKAAIVRAKAYRVQLDSVLQDVKADPAQSRELSLAITKIQEAIMWCGMQLKALNDGQTIYPESYNPANAIVEPTADGLKL